LIVGGDFNEWTDGLVMRSMANATELKNVVTEPSIDHILYRTNQPIQLLEVQRDWGPKHQNAQNTRYEGCLSDHPWVYAKFVIPAGTASELVK
jgi:hypothetical protein